MKFGLALPYNSGRRILKYASLAEEVGWDGLFLGDAIWHEDPMIVLTAAAVVTERIKLGTMVIPVPLRKPWKLASESLALDRLSNGRFILGLATGSVWMGWQGFPDVVTDNRKRAEMLDETIDILTLFYKGDPFDFDGKHFNLKLSLVDKIHYPPSPIQKPRIPIWIPGIWPRKKSMLRTLKCDGLLVEKIGLDGKPVTATPEDVCQISNFIRENRRVDIQFDIVINGNSMDLNESDRIDLFNNWKEAGATWWIEGLWEAGNKEVEEVIREGRPGLG
jgi:hypothetical protein